MAEDNDDLKELNFKKAQYFFEKGTAIHISMKDKEWLNGIIVEPVNADFFMFQEKKKGLMPVFFLEILDMEIYEVEKKDE